MSSFEDRRAHWRSVLDEHRDSGLTIVCAAYDWSRMAVSVNGGSADFGVVSPSK